MKIKFKNVFNSKGTEEKLDEKEDVTVKKETEIRKRRKGAYLNNKKNIDIKECFENLFKNKGKLSKGYYVLLFGMLILGTASVAITFKAYNLFAKEDYEIYADDNTNDENLAVTTLSNNDEKLEEKNSNENTDESKKIVNSNSAEAKTNDQISKNNTKKVNSSKQQEKTTIKPLSFSKPINGEIQKPYSIDKVIYSKTLELWKTHDGIDISAQIGESVKSIEKGTVEKVYEDSFYGTTIVIDHGQGYKSSYSNLNKKVNVKEKQNITKGQLIGKISNTSIGEIKDESHLHFTLFKDNNNVDPTYIFK